MLAFDILLRGQRLAVQLSVRFCHGDSVANDMCSVIGVISMEL